LSDRPMGCTRGQRARRVRGDVRRCRATTYDIRSSRPSTLSPYEVSCSLGLLAHQGQIRKELAALCHLTRGFPFLDERTSRTYVNTLAASCAAFRLAPRLM